MNVAVECFVNGPLENNSYLVVREGSCLVVDPSGDCTSLLESIATRELRVGAIVLTHGHFDHIMGMEQILRIHTDIPTYIHPLDLELLRDPNLNGSHMLGQEFCFSGDTNNLNEGEMEIEGFVCEVLHIPGHSPGGCALLFDDQCISGDVLFQGSIGRSDLPGGDGPLLIAGIREKLLSLSGNTRVYPGHGPETTIDFENKHNMWFS